MYTFLIGGAAGQGIKSAGETLSDMFSNLGYHIFQEDDYPSLVRGGHNFAIITISKEKVYNSNYNNIDFVIALNEETFKHKAKYYISENKGFKIPFKELMKNGDISDIMKNTLFMGVLCYLSGIKLNELNKILKKKKKPEINMRVAKKGYEYAESNFKPVMDIKKIGNNRRIVSGNQAISEGAMAVGLECYIAYPMTPATSVLHILAKQKKIKTVQPENELAAVNMAIGSAYAGAKTMTGTSGGGFALKTEAISMAGMTEIPLVVVLAQRGGPSTGVPTYTSQADLDIAVNCGHGDFPRVVLAPGTMEQAYEISAEALNIAWKYHLPVILLTDKHLSESSATFEPKKNIKEHKTNISTGTKRYKITPTGVSPYLIPGKKGTFVKFNSYEHDEEGYTVEDAKKVKQMQDKRLKKMETLTRDLNKQKSKMYKFYKSKTKKGSKNLVIVWGSSIGAVLDTKIDANILQIICIHPLPDVEKMIKKHKNVVCVEGNATGQICKLITQSTGIKIKNKVLRYDSRPFNTHELKKELERKFK